jgi:hypothetical protein
VAQVNPEEILYRPTDSVKPDGPRNIQKKTLQLICEKFCDTHSLNPSAYEDTGTWNAPYSLALIVKYLAAVADGQVASIQS